MQVHSILESLQQGILICDQHSRIVFFNQVYSDFIGVPLEIAKGHRITEYRKSAIAPEVIWSGIPVEGMVRREGMQDTLQVFIRSGKSIRSAEASQL